VNGEPLPILDSFPFHAVQPPGEFFQLVRLESDEEADAVEKFLGIPQLIKESFKEARRKLRKAKKGAVLIHRWLRPIAQTPQFDVVAVYVQLTGRKDERMATWVVYLVQPKRYEELRQKLLAEHKKLGHEMENLQRGLEGRN
jgi:hypothetical protein